VASTRSQRAQITSGLPTICQLVWFVVMSAFRGLRLEFASRSTLLNSRCDPNLPREILWCHSGEVEISVGKNDHRVAQEALHGEDRGLYDCILGGLTNEQIGLIEASLYSVQDSITFKVGCNTAVAKCAKSGAPSSSCNHRTAQCSFKYFKTRVSGIPK